MEGQAKASSPATMPDAPSAINAPLYRAPVSRSRRRARPPLSRTRRRGDPPPRGCRAAKRARRARTAWRGARAAPVPTSSPRAPRASTAIAREPSMLPPLALPRTLSLQKRRSWRVAKIERRPFALPNTLPEGARNPGGCGSYRTYSPGSATRLRYAAVLPLIITAAGAGLAARGIPPLPPRHDVSCVQHRRRREAAEDADHGRPGDPVDEAKRDAKGEEGDDDEDDQGQDHSRPDSQRAGDEMPPPPGRVPERAGPRGRGPKS
jgi:hypothetical protein